MFILPSFLFQAGVCQRIRLIPERGNDLKKVAPRQKRGAKFTEG
jgi:hypothetical protein